MWHFAHTALGSFNLVTHSFRTVHRKVRIFQDAMTRSSDARFCTTKSRVMKSMRGSGLESAQNSGRITHGEAWGILSQRKLGSLNICKLRADHLWTLRRHCT